MKNAGNFAGEDGGCRRICSGDDITTSIAVLNFAKPGCNDTCGKVRIPYPFGIGANCSYNKWYTIDCNSSMPYLAALSNLEVVGVDLENQTISVNMQKLSACSQTTKSVDLDSSPFLYSKSHNKFVVEGCGNGVILGDHGSVLTGCSTTCSNHTTTNTAVTIDTNNTCFGINCCETKIPHYLNSYSVNLTGLERLGGNRACGSAFLVDKNSYDEVRFSGKSFIPTSLLWTLADYKQLSCCKKYTGHRRTVDLSNGTSVDTLKCWSDDGPLNGNPYLFDGCYDTEECARCKDNGSGISASCHYEKTYDIDGLFNKWNLTCEDDSPMVAIIIGVGLVSRLRVYIWTLRTRPNKCSFSLIFANRSVSRGFRFSGQRFSDLGFRDQGFMDGFINHQVQGLRSGVSMTWSSVSRFITGSKKNPSALLVTCSSITSSALCFLTLSNLTLSPLGHPQLYIPARKIMPAKDPQYRKCLAHWIPNLSETIEKSYHHSKVKPCRCA
ncbi:protein kinase-like domain-containing protein [Artemisia annua]|uniref:Protein kinase-like domain-containing protein n=1 Tax=Artemisia annua TaxID=35608 RepID=A0A2U1NJF2_ARTAN|nr:protein kinase-like domain-containing protein [Artemisia annua]